VGDDAPDFVKNRVAMQDRTMEEIWEKFDGMARALLPLYETDVQGAATLHRMVDQLFV
jgi:hypothetical protein